MRLKEQVTVDRRSDTCIVDLRREKISAVKDSMSNSSNN